MTKANIPMERILAAVEESMFGMTDEGFCTACGAEQIHVEPDARGIECECCGEPAVYGAEELLLGMVG